MIKLTTDLLPPRPLGCSRHRPLNRSGTEACRQHVARCEQILFVQLRAAEIPSGVCGLSTVRAIRSDYWPNSVWACENNRSPAACPSESQCKQKRKLQNVSEKCFLPALRDRTCHAQRAAGLKTGLIPGCWLFSLRSSSKRSPPSFPCDFQRC